MCPSLTSSFSGREGEGGGVGVRVFSSFSMSINLRHISSPVLISKNKTGDRRQCCRLAYRARLKVFLFLSSFLHFFLLLLPGSAYSIPEFPGEIISRILTSFILGLTHSSDTISCACTSPSMCPIVECAHNLTDRMNEILVSTNTVKPPNTTSKT